MGIFDYSFGGQAPGMVAPSSTIGWGTTATPQNLYGTTGGMGLVPSTGDLYSANGLAAFSPDIGPNLNRGLGAGTGSIFDSMLGPNGWGGLALGAAGGLMQGFLGMKQYGLAKKTLEENKRQFQMNYDAQKQSTNTRLEDRQRARVASNSGAYQSVGDYMGANKIA